LPQSSKKIVLIGSNNPTTWIVYNHLISQYGLFPAFIEEPISRLKLLKNRVRKLGLFAVLDQMVFILALRPYINRSSQQRIKQICHTLGLEVTEPLTPAIQPIESVNSESFRKQLAVLNPDIVIINGTRIIGRKTLSATSGRIINTHHGITPAYRGAHGAYWALYQTDKENAGVTVHLVDAGIDTGNIIGSAKIEITAEDSFASYPYLQTAAALPILNQAINDIISGKVKDKPISGTSAVWYHPGFTQYVRGWLRGVR
jgi:folate-dependent phosphoribosylglycinamide formyltransferase PurN